MIGALDPRRFRIEQKHDGCYARITTDAKGRIVRAISRAGKELPIGDLAGVRTAWLDAVLAGEVELWTESANRDAERRGYRVAWIFDLVRFRGRALHREPHSARRDLLLRAQVEHEQEDPDRSWTDDGGGRAHGADGKFARRIPRGWRRCPVVEQFAVSRFDDLWGRCGVEIEGLVICDLSAPTGRGKRKCKPVATLDAVVVDVDARAARLQWAGGSFCVGRGRHNPQRGEVWEVAYSSFYDCGEPRHARLVRLRRDLSAAAIPA
jgi:hypothetical protein